MDGPRLQHHGAQLLEQTTFKDHLLAEREQLDLVGHLTGGEIRSLNSHQITCLVAHHHHLHVSLVLVNLLTGTTGVSQPFCLFSPNIK